MARTKSIIRFPRKTTFTLADIVGFNDGVSIRAVRKYIRESLLACTLSVWGIRPGCGRGRPCYLYEKN